MEVFVAEASEFALRGAGTESEGLHSVIVEGADGVNIRAGGKLLELFLGVVELKDLLNTVEVLSDVVLVDIDSKSFLDLPLHLSL